MTWSFSQGAKMTGCTIAQSRWPAVVPQGEQWDSYPSPLLLVRSQQEHAVEACQWALVSSVFYLPGVDFVRYWAYYSLELKDHVLGFWGIALAKNRLLYGLVCFLQPASNKRSSPSYQALVSMSHLRTRPRGHLAVSSWGSG